ncbi:10 kDa chaperonin 1 [Candidatus Rhabdochlamydia oedothoracis]|uniref:Co-chaperonin GroES n=1 Tax=Candidatus Rhabdochlamydia oedothoracis TaxID=2720720 RepID=A0ABX8V3E0_9BACT|nr:MULTISPECIES: co-chaperone GroES [Rhabdochlamydia]KAG6558925.1 10 kDa chaperonin 1 [Candidatus Rhabdochlamydia sp. W815]QYF48087.1 10 kDa chaperonin 1 [Candidatus Rhabdochlamydia oedothoracis]
MSANHMQPLGDKVLIKRANAKKSQSGILLPESVQEKSREAEVVAVGLGKYDEQGKLRPMHVKVGDCILFSSYAGTEVKTEDEQAEYLIISQDDILGVLV